MRCEMTGQLWGEEEGKEGGRRHEENGGEGGMGSVTLVKIKEGDRRRAFLVSRESPVERKFFTV